MADLFAIIVLMEHLEKAFIRDSITAEEQVFSLFSFSAYLRTQQDKRSSYWRVGVK